MSIISKSVIGEKYDNANGEVCRVETSSLKNVENMKVKTKNSFENSKNWNIITMKMIFYLCVNRLFSFPIRLILILF